MIRPININLNAAHPELPLVEATTFTGAPSSVFIRGVPKAVGNWSITAVSVAVTYPDNTTTSRAAVESAEGVWVATIPGTATSGRTAAGFRILADGIDENGAAVTGYVLGFADFSVLSFTPVPAPGGTFWLFRYFDAVPATPKKGDVAIVGGILKYYNGAAWLPFADLTNYYTKAETDNAIERVAAYYITANAQGSNFATRADLINATTYYSGGVVRVPTRNDYAVVLADETHDGAEWRYIYAVADGATTGQWEAQYPVEGVIAYDNTVTPTSGNGVKSSGIWSALWGALSALPTGFSSLYDWCVAQIAKLRDKLDLNVYSFGNASVTFPRGYSITDGYTTYRPGGTGGVDETIEFYGPITSTAQPQHVYWVPYDYRNATDFDPSAQSVWCLFANAGATVPEYMIYRTGPFFAISDWGTTAPTLTIYFGEESGGHPTMTRPLGTTGDTLAKVSQMNAALAGKLDKSGGTVTGEFQVGALFDGNFQVVPETNDGGYTPPTMRFGDGAGVVGIIWRLVGGYVVMDVSDYLGATYRIALPSASGTFALASAIPYNLVTKTISNGAVSLDDRASNSVTVSATLSPNTLTINFPTAPTGKLRDFAMRLNIAAGVTAPEIAWPQGVTLENNGGEVPEIADGGTGGSSTILYFSESENNGTTAKFTVKGETLTAIAQA